MVRRFHPKRFAARPLHIRGASAPLRCHPGRSAKASATDTETTGVDRSGLKTFGSFVTGVIGAAELPLRRAGETAGGLSVCEQGLMIMCRAAVWCRPDGQSSINAIGNIFCFDPLKPAEIACEGRAIVLLVPRSFVRLPPAAIESVHGGYVDGNAPLGRLLAGQLALISNSAPALSPSEGEALSETISALATAVFDAAGPHSSAEIVSLPLAAIQAFIERNLARPDLSQSLICRHFGLSRSALYRLFAPVGGVAAWIRERRLECARYHLGTMGDRRGCIAQIAAAVGFSSDAAFTRAFRQRYGMTPSAVPAAASSRYVTNPEAAMLWRRRWLDNSRIEAPPAA